MTNRNGWDAGDLWRQCLNYENDLRQASWMSVDSVAFEAIVVLSIPSYTTGCVSLSPFSYPSFSSDVVSSWLGCNGIQRTDLGSILLRDMRSDWPKKLSDLPLSPLRFLCREPVGLWGGLFFVCQEGADSFLMPLCSGSVGLALGASPLGL